MPEVLEVPLLFCPHCRAAYRASSTSCPLDGATLQLEETDPLLGTTIGEQYTITDCIAYGATSRVYRAHHTRLWRRELAIKVLLGDLIAEMSTRMRFAQEAELLSRLDHPNVVSIVDFARTPEGLLYLVMDLAHGPTLAELIRRSGPLPWRRAVALTQQLARGLAHAHEQGIIHRDFKPDNVIVERVGGDERARIIDFGIALPPADEIAPRLTSTGISLGTPAYASPEQALNAALDQRIDLFALGVSLYEMVAGILPFSGNVHELLQHNAFHDPPPIAERNPGVTVPAPLEDLVRRLMARDPEKRYQTADEVVQAIDELLGNLPASQSSQRSAMFTPLQLDANAAASSSAPRRRFARSALWLTAAVAAVALASGGLLASTRLVASAPKLAGTVDAMAAPGQPPMGPAQPVEDPFTVERPEAEAQAPSQTAQPPPAADERPTTTAAGDRPSLPFYRSRTQLPASAEAGQPITRPTDVDPHVAAAIAASRAAASAPPPSNGATTAAPAAAETSPSAADTPGKEPAVAAPAATTAATDPSVPAPAATAPAPAATAPAPAPSAVAATATPAAPPAVTATPPAPPVRPAATPLIATRPAASSAQAKRAAVMRLASHDLQVDGSLSQRTVERAVTRVAAELAGCARHSTARRTKVRFIIDERGRARTITADGGGPALAHCLRNAIGSLRTETPPDVGTVDTILTLSFVPVAS